MKAGATGRGAGRTAGGKKARIAGLLALWALGPAQAACELSLRWHQDPPFSYRRADGEVVGLNTDIVRETLARMGCTVRMLEMPWARALAELEAGRLDVLPGTLRLPERERFARFSAPGPQSRNLLFISHAAQQHHAIGKLADLRHSDFRLGVQLGVSYGPDFEALLTDPVFAQRLHRASSRRSLWLMAAAGRLDGVLANEQTGLTEIAQLGLQDRIKSSGVILPYASAAVAFSRKTVDADFVASFDRTTEGMLKDGSMAALLQRYLKPAAAAPAEGPSQAPAKAAAKPAMPARRADPAPAAR